MTSVGTAKLKREFEAVGAALYQSMAMTSAFSVSLIKDKAALGLTLDNGQAALEFLVETNRLITQAVSTLCKAGLEVGLDQVDMPPPRTVLRLVKEDDPFPRG